MSSYFRNICILIMIYTYYVPYATERYAAADFRSILRVVNVYYYYIPSSM